MLPAEVSRSSSSSDRADKGKARARDSYEDHFCFHAYSAAQSSAAGNETPQVIVGDKTDVKGKARQQATSASGCSHCNATNSTITTHSDHAQRAPRHAAGAMSIQGRQSEQKGHHPTSHHQDATLKRSIRRLGSSPSSSPSQHPVSLPHIESHSSTISPQRSSSGSRATSSSSALPIPAGASSSRPSTANKKRRSDHPSTPVSNDESSSSSTSTSISTSNYPISLEPPSRPALELSGLNAAVLSRTVDALDSPASRPTSSLCPSPLQPEPSSRFQSRRTSLLVNSSTSSTRFLDRNATFRDSPEPISRRTESSPHISERLQQRRSAFLDEARSHRPSGTIPRRRGFYLGDDNPPSRSEPLNDNPAQSSPSDSFMSEFARAVDLRLGARFDNMQSSHSSSSIQTSPAEDSRPAASSWNVPATTWQRNAPQLPDVRAASPFALSFAPDESDDMGFVDAQPPGVGRQRSRLAPLPHRDRMPHTQRDATHPGRRFRPGEAEGTRGMSFSGRAPQSAPVPATQPERAQNTAQQSAAPHPGAGDWQGFRHTLPWPRSHFGIRTPAEYRDRDAPAATTAAATGGRQRFEPFAEPQSSHSRQPSGLSSSISARPASSLRQERAENESALEHLGRLMSHDSMLDEWMASSDLHGPLLRIPIESEVISTNPHLGHHPYAPAPASTWSAGMLDITPPAPRLVFDARNFVADQDWAQLNSYEGLMQLGERLGAAQVSVPQSLIDSLPTCEYARWDGRSCAQHTGEKEELGEMGMGMCKGKGKGKGKQTVPSVEAPLELHRRDTMCPICREDYSDSDIMMSINKCCHAFHAECIKVSTPSRLVWVEWKRLCASLTMVLLLWVCCGCGGCRPGLRRPRPVRCVEQMPLMG